MPTLYEQLKQIENSDHTRLRKNREQRNACIIYQTNPIFDRSRHNAQSIPAALEEINQVNDGIKKILPWKKNRVHNEKLSGLKELIQIPDMRLKTKGLLMPDNPTTLTPLVFGVGALINLGAGSPIDWDTYAGITLGAGAIGTYLATLGAEKKMPIDQARFIESKIRQFY